ncbi:MAG: heme exporter protein CcmD [Woeseiaceae bacterium]|nr:heme exporter protein CcmD [Woeseiaceae bacterium]
MMENLAMGDYGAYVWSCFALTAIVVVLVEWRARLRHRRVYRDIEVRIKALGDRQ